MYESILAGLSILGLLFLAIVLLREGRSYRRIMRLQERAVHRFVDRIELVNCHDNHAAICDLNADMGWNNGSGYAYDELQEGRAKYKRGEL